MSPSAALKITVLPSGCVPATKVPAIKSTSGATTVAACTVHVQTIEPRTAAAIRIGVLLLKCAPSFMIAVPQDNGHWLAARCDEASTRRVVFGKARRRKKGGNGAMRAPFPPFAFRYNVLP